MKLFFFAENESFVTTMRLRGLIRRLHYSSGVTHFSSAFSLTIGFSLSGRNHVVALHYIIHGYYFKTGQSEIFQIKELWKPKLPFQDIWFIKKKLYALQISLYRVWNANCNPSTTLRGWSLAYALCTYLCPKKYQSIIYLATIEIWVHFGKIE